MKSLYKLDVTHKDLVFVVLKQKKYQLGHSTIKQSRIKSNEQRTKANDYSNESLLI